MGYSLNFYLASLENTRLSLTDSDSPWFGNAYPLWVESGDREDNKNSQKRWRDAVSTISTVVQQFVVDPSQSSSMQEDSALALVAGIDSNAEFIDAMNHSGSSGTLFRNRFLGWMGKHGFKQPLLSTWLTKRSLFGLEAESSPSWGYLTFEEVTDLLHQWRKPETRLDEDREEWLQQLLDILKVAQSHRSDVLTVYS